MEYQKKDCNPNRKKRYIQGEHEYGGYPDEHYEIHKEKKIGRMIADFSYFNQAGSVVLTSTSTDSSVEEIIGLVKFKEVFNGDLVNLSGVSTVTVGTISPKNITFKIHKVINPQYNPLLSPTIYVHTISVNPNMTFSVPLEFVDVFIDSEDEVNYYYTVSIPSGVAATATVSNSTHTGNLYR
ncbi:hypothetical protein [Priestia aryabhattai]|uniref:hypothetical protein n=1 Tax=Priestia aryabhattai TaxID=412384 RepID=UPI001C8E3630|nr:hypothetical protein [Priestia aryabhattai]MBY0065198.1 hypothetical protein [Priestia aryabhattai]